MSTVLSLLPMTRRNSKTARIRALRPTTTESSDNVAAVIALHQTQRFELRQLVTQRALDAEVERHVRARATGAHPGQLDVHRVAVHSDHFDVAAIGLQERPDSTEHRFHAFLGNHAG